VNKFASYEKEGNSESAEFYADGVLYNLERDTDDELSFGNWYAIVKDQYGEYAMEGWIDDSSSYGLYKAYCMAASLCDEEAMPYDELKAILKI